MLNTVSVQCPSTKPGLDPIWRRGDPVCAKVGEPWCPRQGQYLQGAAAAEVSVVGVSPIGMAAVTCDDSRGTVRVAKQDLPGFPAPTYIRPLGNSPPQCMHNTPSCLPRGALGRAGVCCKLCLKQDKKEFFKEEVLGKAAHPQRASLLPSPPAVSSAQV